MPGPSRELLVRMGLLEPEPPETLADRVLRNIKPNPRKFSDEEQELRDLWNRQEFEDGIPKSPPLFRENQPNIIGTELARIAEKFFKIAPNLRGKTSHIQFGPGKPAIQYIQSAGKPPDLFGRLNLMGVTDKRSREINLNPSLGTVSGPGKPPGEFMQPAYSEYDEFPPDEVLGHEFTHAAGYHGESEPDAAMELIRRMKELGIR